jgi:ABC-2 type transport system permease protein
MIIRSVASFLIRTFGFVRKELVEILRQSRLMLTLVLGPFLILLLFGLGFRNEARVLRTVFVVPTGQEAISDQVRDYATSLGPQIDYLGMTGNEGQALSYLSRGVVDAVVIVPDRVEQRIRDSEQPVVRLFHREIDPFQVSYVDYIAQIYVDELNRRVLRSIAEEGQQDAGDVQVELQTAKTSARAMREAFDRGDGAAAQRERSEMNRSLSVLSVGVGASLGVLQGVEETVGGGQTGGQTTASQILSTLAGISAANESLEDTPTDRTSYNEEAQRAREIEEELDRLDTQLTDFRSIEPHVLVSPFRAEAVSINNVVLNSSDFFAPGVIVLLLQHLLTTFAALSIVRERLSGTMEMFRVAPVSAFETLLGKYIAYLLIGILLGAGISALVVMVLRVPMMGNWTFFAMALLAVMFAALGIGFLISLISETTSQAVQFAMLVLLFSIFFSGFFLDLRLMWENLRFLAWIIPSTYGLQMLQQIMFRATMFELNMMLGLLGMGVLLFLVSWLLLNFQMKTR